MCGVNFQADPRLLDDIVGLKPDQEKHQFQIDILPVSGLPLIFFRFAYSARLLPLLPLDIVLQAYVLPPTFFGCASLR
jgi:hypothetical protein